MRELILVPIVHLPSDMGSMAAELMKVGKQKLGLEKWKENEAKIQKYWAEVEQALEKLKLDWSTVRIYQDGLPHAGEELVKRIVEKAEQQQSQNYKLLKKLLEKGASIEGTESPALLVKEFTSIRAWLQSQDETERKRAKEAYERTKGKLLNQRDSFIADRINETLKPGETGILFVGAHHQVGSKLSSDIRVKKLD